ncbi:hypothetical protein M3A49_15270 [Paraburkholderia sp. CNPSo 3076]|uniref:hypothetical protein n=1 Tax=Paraburkholderia sp. CNPSo 3076 TaxID=2940936 RepID=UPI002253A999|nr:hypothetical protein [Paraburkholderia sp. CNPSo 3076]MCX5540841.1 hypothetical protein [Paraburkholderia sp. CNPSo 3076]
MTAAKKRVRMIETTVLSDDWYVLRKVTFDFLRNLRKVFEAYMSPGSVTEKLYFYLGEYDPAERPGAGGGVEEEGEDLEVVEVPLGEALRMIERGEIVDGKTIMLLQHAALRGLAR